MVDLTKSEIKLEGNDARACYMSVSRRNVTGKVHVATPNKVYIYGVTYVNV